MSRQNEDLVRVENTTSRVLGLPQVDGYLPKPLQPGFNNVPEGHLAALEDNRVVRDWYDKGWLVIHDHGENEPEGPIAPKSLASYNTEASIKFIKLEHDLDILRMWRSNEDRKGVKAALDARISELAGIQLTGQSDDEDDEELDLVEE